MKQLGINPEMDALARKHNLGHWSCVSPLNGRLWVRSDGKEASTAWNDEKYIVLYAFETLKEMDSKYPIGKGWQQLKDITDPVGDLQYQCAQEKMNDLISSKQPTPENKANKLLKIALGVINQFADYNDSTSAAKKDIEDYFNGSPSQPTLVQKPFQYPCDGALYFDAETNEQYHVEEEIMNGRAGSVIMFVWE